MEENVNRPLGDLLEEILQKGPSAYAGHIRRFPACQASNRCAILLGGLALGPGLQDTIYDLVTKPESQEKFAVMTGLAEMGYPDVEGYFIQYLRGGKPDKPTKSAIRSLTSLKSKKALEYLEKLSEDPFLFPDAAYALSRIGGERAGEILLSHSERWEAVEPLSRMGYKPSREFFLEALRQGPPMNLAGITALGIIGNPEDGPKISALIESRTPEVSREAFLAYARMGAPQGIEPLVRAASKDFQPWMAEPLCALESPETCKIFRKALEPPGSGSLLKKLAFWKQQEQKPDRAMLYGCLAGCTDPSVVGELAARLRQNPSKAELRAILKNRSIYKLDGMEKELLAIVRGEDLYASYLAARGWMESPSKDFLIAAVRLLRMPGFVELDSVTAIMDPQHLLDSRAAELNPVLLVGRFLESGLVDLGVLQKKLKARFGQKKYPPAIPPGKRFSALEDGGFGPFLEALAAAHSPIKDELSRIWELFLDTEDDSVPLFELFWSESGLHRGGIQRLIMRTLETGVNRWIEGKDDKFLREVDSVESTIPRDGPLAVKVLAVFGSARVKLMSECKDMVVWMEGGRQRGDMVLIEKL